MKRTLPIVAIVGRPNVGKSALFNAILRQRISIVHEQSGVTRDRVTATGEYFGQKFLLVDTGGLGVHYKEKTADLFDGMIREQVAQVVAEADALVWVVNIQEGITPQDEEVAEFLRQANKPVVIAANKGDNEDMRMEAEGLFAALGIKDIVPTSCAHSTGIDDLLEKVMEKLPEDVRLGDGEAQAEEEPLRIAVVGRPNVGKSSLVNRLLGEERMMVSDVPGTTRDAVDIPVTLTCDNLPVPVVLVDTAGMRRQKQIDTVVEFFSLSRSTAAIKRADLILFMIDATAPGTTQDRRIAHSIVEERKPCIILANKRDLLERGTKDQEVLATIRKELPFMNHAPVMMISVLKNFQLQAIAQRLLHVREQMAVTVPTAVFNQFLQDTLTRNPPPSSGMQRFKILYGTMKGCPPPKFVLFVNKKSLCPAHYRQFLENRIREVFYPEAGLPIILEFRERESHQGETAAPARRAAAGGKRQKEQQFQAKQKRIQRRRGFQ